MELLLSRKIDELGRITLPSELRIKMGWRTDDEVSIYKVDDNTLILQSKPTSPKCAI